MDRSEERTVMVKFLKEKLSLPLKRIAANFFWTLMKNGCSEEDILAPLYYMMKMLVADPRLSGTINHGGIKYTRTKGNVTYTRLR